MSRLHVRNIQDEERMQISVHYGHNGGKIKEYNFDRPQLENVEKMMIRLKTSIINKTTRKKRKLEEEETEVNIKLISQSGKYLDGETVNREALISGTVLQIQDCKMPVIVNPPKILLLKLPTDNMAGFPIFPQFEVEFANIEFCKFTWYRIKLTYAGANVMNTADICEIIEVSIDQVYSPSVDDVGHFLQVKCVPSDGDRCGDEVMLYSKKEISAGPGICPFENRHEFTTDMTRWNCFRVMTYNILADMFADTDFTKKQLYSYCASYALSFDYRRQLLLKEIMGYNVDIMCLQEVEKKHFMQTFIPVFERLGFTGLHQLKGGTSNEGEAIFYRNSRFRFVCDHSIMIRQIVETNPKFADLQSKIKGSKNVCDQFYKLGTVLQLVILESVDKPGQKICVGNTHLFFYPSADHIRLLQAIICIRHIEDVLHSYTEKGDKVSLVVCGDFNSRPQSGVHKFFTEGKVAADLSDWTEQEYKQDRLPDMSYSHSLSLTSACGYPEYTNYVGNFHSQLDYVFIDHSFKVEKVVPSPTHEEVIAHTALPSVVFPSDHIAQICDLKWIL